MHEIELKFQVPAEARRAVQSAVAGAGSRRTRLLAAYYDTPQRHLAQAGLALRLRKEGRRWVQTLKGAGEHAMQRLEHNVELAASAGQRPAVDPRRHAGTPAGERLFAVLPDGAQLQEQYGTDVVRTHRTVRTRRGTVELAFDEGHIHAGDRRLPVCELEVELVSGQAIGVVEVGRRWVRQHGLWLDVRTKAERGERLMRGLDRTDPAKAEPIALHKDATVSAGWHTALRSCLAHALSNASEIAAGCGSVEHLHQLRVGLRRLRSALRLFEGWGAPADPALVDEVTRVFRTLSQTRDFDVQSELQPVLLAAGAPDMPLPGEQPQASPEQLMREPGTTLVLLGLLGWLVGAPGPAAEGQPEPGAALRPLAAQRLKRWHRQVARLATGFDSLDDTARHRLRKRVKRLRYAIEFVAPLFAPRRVERYLRRLRPAQEALGRFNDVVVASASYRERAAEDPRAWFAVGWLASQREAALAECRSTLAPLADAPAFWK